MADIFSDCTPPSRLRQGLSLRLEMRHCLGRPCFPSAETDDRHAATSEFDCVDMHAAGPNSRLQACTHSQCLALYRTSQPPD